MTFYYSSRTSTEVTFKTQRYSIYSHRGLLLSNCPISVHWSLLETYTLGLEDAFNLFSLSVNIFYQCPLARILNLKACQDVECAAECDIKTWNPPTGSNKFLSRSSPAYSRRFSTPVGTGRFIPRQEPLKSPKLEEKQIQPQEKPLSPQSVYVQVKKKN